MIRRPYAFAVAVALTAGLLAVAGAIWLGLPLRDPDGVAGPSYIRLPGIVLLALAADIVPRAWYRTPRMINFFTTARQIIRERWSWERLRLVVIGLGCFYLSYVAYRNIKSFLPFVNGAEFDDFLSSLDRTLLFGHRPAVVLHDILGTGVAAHALSTVYVFYLFFVPLSLAAALVWSTDIYKGFWYVTALCLNWVLGAASYYLLPSLGPVYLHRSDFDDLPETGASALQSSLLWGRWDVLTDPHATEAVHGIAAFASLHVSVVFTAALIAHRLGMNRWLRWAMWIYTAAHRRSPRSTSAGTTSPTTSRGSASATCRSHSGPRPPATTRGRCDASLPTRDRTAPLTTTPLPTAPSTTAVTTRTATTRRWPPARSTPTAERRPFSSPPRSRGCRGPAR